jgi:hypothetical protein
MEHASVPATLKSIFGLSSDYLTARDANANHFVREDEYLEDMRQDCPKVLPEVPTDQPML